MTLDKRYQVFISSTFRDLIDERQAVLKAVLELDHMPAGMELFPASDETAWDLIKDVIDASDYYLLIIGGRYGSLDSEGIGYTEKEYDYAVKSKKAVIPFLIKDPDKLPRGNTETDEQAWEKLVNFRKKVEDAHTCVYWTSVHDLKSSVIVGLTSVVKKRPAVGWIRADKVPSEATISEILSLRNRVAELEVELQGSRSGPPAGAEYLAQGDDKAKFEATVRPYDDFLGVEYRVTIEPTWNEVFSLVSGSLISEVRETRLRRSIQEIIGALAYQEAEKTEKLKGQSFRHGKISEHDVDTIIIQLRALGLIQESAKKRSVTDTATYWILTPYGDNLMVKMRAIRKSDK
ncbi:DUF4062 domain-containing protein [Sneathiella sp. HT1-7]|uniref:DUF4062 domain-containing protein n=1 Tax=Sneathiella sp. HT1-7 TaxID=2887192 RepID=UPI001D13F457|nr:DUF4062 domain-containing protein [Sneathiella sp. HT1-7]MCC3303827.1 DUF4062 domain-containing protein [Sneathiella sp. HT1-7]